MKTIALRVSKWGNDLAVRLPVAYVRRVGIRDGDTLELQEAADGTLSIKLTKAFDRAAYVRKLNRVAVAAPVDESTVERMRRGSRY